MSSNPSESPAPIAAAAAAANDFPRDSQPLPLPHDPPNPIATPPPTPTHPLPPLPASPQPGLYRHYKGNEYCVHHLARHSETQEVMVVYQLMYGDRSFWLRPHAMFVESVTLDDGSRVPRFARVGGE